MSEDSGEGSTTGLTRSSGTPAIILLSDRFGIWGQRKLLASSVLVVRSGGIGYTLLILLGSSNVGRITVVDHNDVEVSNLRWQVTHTEGRRET